MRPVRSAEAQAALAPVEDYLAELHARIAEVTGGKPADYIPELGKADPNLFGIAIATVDGQVYAVGDAESPSPSNRCRSPSCTATRSQHYGREAVLKHVGVEPTGEAFNSIVLDEVANRPFNPMVNAGAIAVAELMRGRDARRSASRICSRCSPASPARKLEIDEAVFRSELATGHRNRAIAYMMLNFGMIDARSERGARPLFPAMLGERHLPRSCRSWPRRSPMTARTRSPARPCSTRNMCATCCR